MFRDLRLVKEGQWLSTREKTPQGWTAVVPVNACKEVDVLDEGVLIWRCKSV